MPEQFAAVTGRPCVKLGFTRQTEVADLIGGTGVSGGDTSWQDGALIQAVKRPGTVIILDELTIAPTGVQAIIQLIADDHRSYTLPTGEKVVCAPGVVFVTADNTNGAGDETGQYHGTNQSNGALINRFKRMIEIDYMSKSDEAKALVNHTGCPRPAADSLTDFIARARKLPEMEGVIMSLRQMVGFIQTVQDGFDVTEAAKVAFLNRLPRAERAAMQTLFTLAWGNEFSAAMAGSAIDTSQAPVTSAAGQAFDDEISASLNR
jgi:MoxR-like ATPase